ncbi:deoxyribodipyrimidine photo-lyase [Mariniluteicoccus endophyticus]
MTTSILWLRRDLRRHDLPALAAAADDGDSVLPLFVADPALMASAGPVRGHCLLDALEHVRTAYDGALVVRCGDPVEVVARVAREVGADRVHVSGEVHPYGRRRDVRVRAALAAEGRALVATGTPYAVDPGTIRKGDGDPFKVFTPFSKAWRTRLADRGYSPVPDVLPRWVRGVETEPLEAVRALGQGGGEDVDLPPCSEEAALARWAEFLDDGLANYADARDRPDLDGTSQLSMHLKYGTIHPRRLLADLADAAQRTGRAEQEGRAGAADEGVDRFVTELCWREFYADVLHHHPESAWADLRPELARLAYDDPDTDEDVAEVFAAWQEGRTGFPIVDAGMRQLRATGWMHNRMRMVTASFLTKDLHIWWPHGARHFLHWLRDGDVASNNHGWQWVAGTGTDAAPYFRVFNPVTQGKKFDPQGDYVRLWVPELAHLPGAKVHEPWTVADGYAQGYPEPVVDHGEERAEALRRYQVARG